MAVTAFAPAKVNLYLHVTGRRDDGYHLLDSLVAFADIGDRLTAEPAASLSLTVDGPEAADLAAVGDDNLVLRAARLLADRAGITAGAALHLDKHLPVAAGIGGGSSDAAAALLALKRLWRVSLEDEALCALGARLGADVPACLYRRAVWVGGIGERLEPAGAAAGSRHSARQSAQQRCRPPRYSPPGAARSAMSDGSRRCRATPRPLPVH